MRATNETRKPTATTNGEGRGARCVAIVNAANIALALSSAAMVAGCSGTGGADWTLAGLIALAALSACLLRIDRKGKGARDEA